MAIEQPPGAALESVTYYTVEGQARAENVAFAGFHSVDFGFELRFAGGRTYSAVWNLRLPTAWVSFSEHPMGRVVSTDGCDAVEVGRWPDWRPLVGQTCWVTAVAGPKPDASGWTDVGFHLDFAGGERVTVALGTLADDGGLEYQPDDLVVIFDRALADEYITDLQRG
ncbi:MAG: hypothetical protein GEV07_03025 [Streptosporangiales bacterium]|nr:hypothetical protein [Streptosporangiales bacterium]